MTKQTTPVSSEQETDLFTPFIKGTVAFCKRNKSSIITALVVLVLAAVIGTAYCAHQQKITEKSWEAYYNAQVTLLSQGQDAALPALDKVAIDFPNTPAATYSILQKGDLLFATENYAQAADAYKQITDSKSETLRTAAILSEGAALQASQDYTSSIELMQNFIAKNPKNFALPQAYFTLALSQELSGDSAAALETYKTLVENYAKTYFGMVAKEKINELQK